MFLKTEGFKKLEFTLFLSVLFLFAIDIVDANQVFIIAI